MGLLRAGKAREGDIQRLFISSLLFLSPSPIPLLSFRRFYCYKEWHLVPPPKKKGKEKEKKSKPKPKPSKRIIKLKKIFPGV